MKSHCIVPQFSQHQQLSHMQHYFPKMKGRGDKGSLENLSVLMTLSVLLGDGRILLGEFFSLKRLGVPPNPPEKNLQYFRQRIEYNFVLKHY